MSWRDRWNAWRFLCDLLEDGPEYFMQFRPEVEDPEVIEQVPFTPGEPTELRLAQGGVGRPDAASQPSSQPDSSADDNMDVLSPSPDGSNNGSVAESLSESESSSSDA